MERLELRLKEKISTPQREDIFTYLCFSPANPTEISKALSVPNSSVAQLLDSLHTIGVVNETSDGREKKYSLNWRFWVDQTISSLEIELTEAEKSRITEIVSDKDFLTTRYLFLKTDLSQKLLKEFFEVKKEIDEILDLMLHATMRDSSTLTYYVVASILMEYPVFDFLKPDIETKKTLDKELLEKRFVDVVNDTIEKLERVYLKKLVPPITKDALQKVADMQNNVKEIVKPAFMKKLKKEAGVV